MFCLGYEPDVWLQDRESATLHHTDRSHRQYGHSYKYSTLLQHFLWTEYTVRRLNLTSTLRLTFKQIYKKQKNLQNLQSEQN